MKPCAAVGLEPTWFCNERCVMCYYLRDPRLGTQEGRTLKEMQEEILKAKRRSCYIGYFCGQGEPSAYRHIIETIQFLTDQHMGSAMITNGTSPVKRYEKMYEAGFDHPHISMHGLGETLDAITQFKGAAKKQGELLKWLHANNLPFRTNSTVQRLNYKQLPDIARAAIDHGVKHWVAINFLPHYEWANHFEEVGVPSAETKPYIEEAADLVLKAGRMLTIRYYPHCMLDPRFWPYVTNAQYVPFDPFEWDNGRCDTDIEKVWKFGLQLRDQVAVKGKPCSDCRLNLHCGGWNKVSVQHDGGHIHALTDADIPDTYRSIIDVRGGLHDLNPANAHSGLLRPKTLANVAKLADDPDYGSALKGGKRRTALPVV